MIVTALCIGMALGDWTSLRPTSDGNAVVSGSLQLPLRRAWVAKLPSAVENVVAIAQERCVVATMDGVLQCRRVSDGHLLWSYKNHSAFAASPTVDNGRIFLGDSGGEFHCFDLQTGKRLWARQTGDKIVSSALVVGDRVLFGSYDCRLYCLRAKDGRPVWTHASRAQIHASPTLRRDEVWFAGCDGSVHALSAKQGRRIRQVHLGGNFAATAVLVGQGPFVANSTGLVASLDWSGKVRWSVREREDGAGVYGTLVIAGNLALIPSRSGRVYALNTDTGRLVWTYRTTAPVESSVIVVGTVAIFGDEAGWLHFVRASDGRGLWRTRLGGAIKGSASWNGRQLLIGTSDGQVWAFVSGR